MSVTYTASSGNINNYPVPADWSLNKSDFTITLAQAETMIIETGEYNWPQWPDEGPKFYQMTIQGEFSYSGPVTGLKVDASEALLNTVNITSWSLVTRDAGGIIIASETTAYTQPVSKDVFFADWSGETLSDKQIEFRGDDMFSGATDSPDDDTIHGHDGDDRFVMTYGDNNGDKFVGGDGVDTAVLPSASRNWTIESGLVWDEINQSSTLEGFRITDQSRTTGNTLEISAVEILEFPDVSLRLSEGSWVEFAPVTSAPVTSAPVISAPVTSDLNVTDSVVTGTYGLTAIANVFGSIMFLDGLTETVTSTSHTIEYNGTIFDFVEVDGMITTVVRDGEFTSEFAAEIAESFPDSAGISYSTAVALIGQANMESTLMMVAGADGNYVG